MKLAHTVIVTPKLCGLYETTRDLVMALRKRGIDSRLVDPTFDKNKHHPKTTEDRGAPLCQDMEWVKSADYMVNHSGLGAMGGLGVPLIQVAHGNPRVSLHAEETKRVAIYKYYYEQNKNDMVKAMITFWPEHVPYWEGLFSAKPVHLIPAMIDCNEWDMDAPNYYDFKGNKAKINVVLTDPCRLNLDPFEAFHAWILWARKNPGAKLHIYGTQYNGMPGWTSFLRTMKDDGSLGEMGGWVKNGLNNLYAAADFMLTSNPIATRSKREAMASGCPVALVRDIVKDQANMTAALSVGRLETRKQAETMFNPERASRAFVEMLASIKPTMKVVA